MEKINEVTSIAKNILENIFFITILFLNNCLLFRIFLGERFGNFTQVFKQFFCFKSRYEYQIFL